MFDFVDDELRHQPVSDQLDSVFVHLREELFAVGVDEAHVCEINECREWRLAGDRALPALLEFRDTRAGQSPFDKETNVAVNNSGCDS